MYGGVMRWSPTPSASVTLVTGLSRLGADWIANLLPSVGVRGWTGPLQPAIHVVMWSLRGKGGPGATESHMRGHLGLTSKNTIYHNKFGLSHWYVYTYICFHIEPRLTKRMGDVDLNLDILASVIFSLKAQLLTLQVAHDWQWYEFSGVYVCEQVCVSVWWMRHEL